jgi:hypothetical protein
VSILELESRSEASQVQHALCLTLIFTQRLILCVIQLLEALLECIQVSLAAGAVEALAELFNSAAGASINAKLKPLVGQVRSSNWFAVQTDWR